VRGSKREKLNVHTEPEPDRVGGLIGLLGGTQLERTVYYASRRFSLLLLETKVHGRAKAGGWASQREPGTKQLPILYLDE